MRALLLLGLMLASACNLTPSTIAEAGTGTPDAGGDSVLDGTSGQVTVLWDRPFGVEGERPTQLEPGKDGRLFAVSSRAIYTLDDQARQLSRVALPTGTGGALPLVQSARWDGAGLGLTLRWPGDSAVAATWAVVLTDGTGAFKASAMAPVVSIYRDARGALVDGKTHATLHTSALGSWGSFHIRRQERGKAVATQGYTASISEKATIGDWAALPGVASAGLGLCTVDPGGKVTLHTVGSGSAFGTTSVYTSMSRPALGSCRLTGSGRSALVAYDLQALPYAQLDLGPGAPDMGVKGVSYPEPTARVVPASGGAISAPIKLSHTQGVVQVLDVLWDGSRYLVLVNRVSYRGGQLMLTALDETGGLLARDLLIPLAYEPGTLLGARMQADTSGYTLLFASRRPWDEGVLHMARFTVRW